jgi:23S rRNA pseudouridine2605 synthase
MSASPSRRSTSRGRATPSHSRKTTRSKRTDRPSRAPKSIHKPQGVRLQKILAQAGIASRRKAEELIADGQVAVNGNVVTELGVRIDPQHDKVTCGGKPVRAETPIYLLLNKPDQVVCSAEGTVDERGRPTVLSLLHGVTTRVFPVGRLDYHSRGVLILTNDGTFSAMVASPRTGILKTYHVKFQGYLSPTALKALKEGVVLEDGVRTRPAEQVEVIRQTTTNTWVQIAITQGLNRQIRRMGEAVGHTVLKIIRVAIGPVTADGLADGEFRHLIPSEVDALRHHRAIAEATQKRS